MKYEYYPKRRTEQERRELNEQILRLLQSGACEQAGLTDEDIFNRYTGDGGLHGLRRSDYDSYNAFSAAKKELENGQFFTPPPLCEMIVSALRLSDTDLVADLTCGMGNFFNFLPNERNAYGCEVDPNACAVARKLYPQAHIVHGDIRDYRRVGDWHLAEDLVQETFLTACCKSERVCAHKKPVAWLFETLNNLTLRESRRFYHMQRFRTVRA